MSQVERRPTLNNRDHSRWSELVDRSVKSLRYGVVEVTVHDSRVVQIGKTERVRLDKAGHHIGITT